MFLVVDFLLGFLLGGEGRQKGKLVERMIFCKLLRFL